MTHRFAWVTGGATGALSPQEYGYADGDPNGLHIQVRA